MDGAAVGLAFLDTALRQNHVRRLTERLTLVEHRAARCTTEVDISLGLLDDGQREAGLSYQRLRNRRGPRDRNGDTAPGANPIWVPVSRMSRRSHAPMDVLDAEGVKLPRLTQYETSRLLASALYRLLRAVLLAHPDAGLPHTRLNDFLFRFDDSRWLVQAALVALLTERSKPATPSRLRSRTEGTVEGRGARCRQHALRVLEDYAGSLHEYLTLLDVAVNDYLLVVALDASRDEHVLAFDSPLHVMERPKEHVLRRSLRLAGGPYWVRYTTELPASLRAYHLVAETESGLQIEAMHLATDADRGIVTALRSDLTTLSSRIQDERRSPNGEKGRKLLELELQTELRRLSELLRRRRWEASQAGVACPDDRLSAASELAWASASGETTARDGEAHGSLLDHPLVTPEKLSQAAEEIGVHELMHDLSLENDPASGRGHVYWRRDPSRVDVSQNISISSSMFLGDASGSRPGIVVLYVACVVAASYLLGCLLFGSFFPYVGPEPLNVSGNADAIVAVLLLVPGFLYTRLGLPVRQSIAGQLRILPRYVAVAAIGCAAVLAATIAVGANPVLVRGALALCAVVPLSAVCVLLWVKYSTAPLDLSRAGPGLPRWAREEESASGAGPTGWRASARSIARLGLPRAVSRSPEQPDAVFLTSGARS